MNKDKIAILVDSCVDVPPVLIEKYNMYEVPLKVIYKDREYLDGVDITPEEVYERFDIEIPTTSLPDGSYITSMFDKIKEDGFEKVLAVTLSSGLSGTYNYIKLLASKYEGLDIHVFDTKNIGIGGGFHAIQAAEYLKDEMDWETLKKTVNEKVLDVKTVFCLDTLKYLQKGGRIGLVPALFGSSLNLKPIISCNEDGVYYAMAKVIGRKRSLQRAMDIIIDFVGDHKNYNLGVVHGGALEEANRIKELLISKLPHSKIFVEGQISPVLGVHTGIGTIGIVAQKV